MTEEDFYGSWAHSSTCWACALVDKAATPVPRVRLLAYLASIQRMLNRHESVSATERPTQAAQLVASGSSGFSKPALKEGMHGRLPITCS